MNRSSTDRAEARLSLTIFLALSFLSVGLFTLTARSGIAPASAGLTVKATGKIGWPGRHPLPPTPEDSVSLTTLGAPVCENFDTLANTGTSSTTPPGWTFSEAGANADTTYAAGTGSLSTGNTYSFGSTGSTDRAFGGLRSSSLVPTIGASFTNNTGQTIISILIAYTGEEWRLGTAARTDELDFQISTDATSLTTGTWTAVTSLNFVTPNTVAPTGAKDGNAAGNRTMISSTISGLSIPDGATFWIRWLDIDASAADDGLAIDDFCLTPTGGGATPTPSPPTATTNAATNVTDVSATLNGTVNPNGASTTVHFEYGPDTNYGTQTPDQIFAGSTDQNVSANLSPLTPGATYHYRVVAVNVAGPAMGSDVMFMTAASTPTPTPTPTPSPFSACDLVIYRVGAGSAALDASATAVFLDEYTTAGALVQSIAMPTSVNGPNKRLTAAGNANSEGLLTLSTNGQYLVATGYDADVGTAGISGTTSSVNNRVIARIASDGTVDTTTALTDAASGSNPRSTVTTNGTDMWITGGAGGIRHTTLGATTSLQLSTTPTTLRATNIFNGQLYVSAMSGTTRLATVGVGTPTTTGQTITNLPGYPTLGSPYAFFFADLDVGVPGVDTVYVAEDGLGTGAPPAGIYKYSFDGTNWNSNGSIAGTTPRGLTGVVNGSIVTLYVTNGTNLLTLTDTSGYNATITGTLATLASASTNTAFRGIAFVPVQCGGPMIHFEVTAPDNAIAGTAFNNLTVTARDQLNQIVTDYSGTVHFTSTDGQAVLPADTMLTNGTGTFSATLRTAGNQTITATDSANFSITGTSNSIAVSATAATHLAVSAPGSATAGTPFSITVTARDQFNNTATGYTGTVHFTTSDSGAGSAVPMDYTFGASDNGIHTFGNGVTFVTVGNQTVTATDTVTTSITGTSSNVAVSAATATHFTVSAPASATAGASFNFTVTALDQFNNVATGYAGTVHFTSSDGQAILPANNTLTNGIRTFSATLGTVGPQTITATDTVTSSITGTSNSVSVSAASANHFAVSAPASATAGTPFSITVTALDQFNNTASGYRGTVHFTKSDNGASSTVPANYTFLAGDNGIHTFTNGVTFVTAGNQTVTATDTVTSSITGTSNNVLVSATTATHFTVTAPATVPRGTAFNFTVTAQDQFNNTATGYGGTVHFTSTDGSASLPANSTLTNGAGTFSATLNTAGNQTITATDTLNGSITGTSNNIDVSAATHFSVSAPGSATAGTAFNFTVTALDASNNTVTNYSGTVHFTSTDGQAVLPANSTLTNGTGTFSATLKTAGNQTITATDTVSSITGTSGNISVTAIAATHLAVSAPANATAGTPFSITVTAQDPFNNTASGYRGTVHFTKSDNGAGSTVPANYTFLAGDNGIHAFTNGVTFVTAGNQTITATDTVTSSITGTSNNVAVSAATANHFSVTAPANATAGTSFNFTVTALDQFNNTATGYAGTVHFTSTDGQATLPANSGLTSGTGTFSATLGTVGNQTITATDTVSSSITGTSNLILVSAGTATHFSVSAPANATAGSAFNFTVTAKDQFNNTATGYSGTVHFTSTDGQATLPANSTLTNGTGTFSATLKTAGNQTITATDTVTISITGTSNNITVSAAAATHFSVSAPANATAGTAFNFTVTAQDQFGNTATGYAGTVHFTSSDGQAVLPANSTLVSGTRTFSATLKTAGNQSITATDTVTSSITGASGTIVVSAGPATHFTVSAPGSATPNVPFNFAVTAQDQFNNTATGYTGTVHFTSTDGQATLPANSTLTNGTRIFQATLKTVGNQTITATDTVTGSITGTSNTIIVSPNGVITDPVPGSTLFSSSVTFRWNAGIGATAYWLTIGDDKSNSSPCGDPSKAGGSNIFSSGQTGALSWNVTGLPTDGRTLYVRLLTKINGVWYTPPQDYVYTAGTGNPLAPGIAPNGGTFTNTVTINIASATPCVPIYYMATGAVSTGGWVPFSYPLIINTHGTTTVKAKAVRGTSESTITTAAFTIN
jgi:hypothetical protein